MATARRITEVVTAEELLEDNWSDNIQGWNGTHEDLFGMLSERFEALEVQVQELHAEVQELHAENNWLRQENERINHLLAFQGFTSFRQDSYDAGLQLVKKGIAVKVELVPLPDSHVDHLGRGYPYGHALHIVPLYDEAEPEAGAPAWWERLDDGSQALPG